MTTSPRPTPRPCPGPVDHAAESNVVARGSPNWAAVCIIAGVENAVTRYCAATEAGDMAAMATTLASGVELPSPLFGRMTFKGDDVRGILTVVYSVLRGVDWEPPVGDGATFLAVTHARILGMRIDDSMVFELDEQGKISRIRPHLRPLAATVLFALAVGPRVAAKPLMALRALRRA
jgi:hypothetical protein